MNEWDALKAITKFANKGRVRVTITFDVDEECVPGVFYNPQDFASIGYDTLESSFKAYKPTLVDKKVEIVKNEA